MPHKSRTPFRWNSLAKRYIDSKGRFVPQSHVLDALEDQIIVAQKRMNNIAMKLVNGEIDLADAQLLGMDEIKIVNTASAALAKGGWAQMTPSDWGLTGRIIRDEYKEFETFLNKVTTSRVPENGKIRLFKLDGSPNGQFLKQFDQFAQGGIKSFNDILRTEASARGATHELRTLDNKAQHCNCCIKEAGHPEKIGTLRSIGDCTCQNNCRCKKTFGVMVDDKFVEV